MAVIDWRQLTGEEKRHAYMASHAWAIKRAAVKARCRGVCELCRRRKMTQVHHQTYARLYDELLTDLLGMCGKCHQDHHAIPTAVKEPMRDTSVEADNAWRNGDHDKARELLEEMVEQRKRRDARDRARIENAWK